MNVEKMKSEEQASHTGQRKSREQALQMQDNRKLSAMQSGLAGAIQRDDEEDDEAIMQGKFESENQTGIPDDVKSSMEESFGSDFSGVRVHPDSSSAPEVGALAYTQGTDIHFAPGQFKPDTAEGRQLLGHELTHVVQQSEGRVQPTTEVGGMPVNDDAGLEREADNLGAKAASLTP